MPGNALNNKAMKLPALFCWLAMAWLLASFRTPATGQGRFGPAQPPGILRLAAGGGRPDCGLKERFGEDEGARLIRGRFLEALLTEGFPGFKVPRSGIFLLHAVTPDILSLQYAEVNHAPFFGRLPVPGGVDLQWQPFQKTLGLKQAVFEQQADFHQAKADLDAFFGEAVFKGPVDFGAARIEGNLVFKDARFTAKDLEANFNVVQAGGSLNCENAVFAGGVDLTGSRLGAELDAKGARFASPDKMARLTR